MRTYSTGFIQLALAPEVLASVHTDSETSLQKFLSATPAHFVNLKGENTMLHKRNGVLCSTLLTFVFALCSLSALGQKQSIDPNSPASVQSKPIVIQEVGHAVTPPLRDIPPVLPAGGTNRVIPVRPLHPFSTTAAPTTEDPVWQQFVVKNVAIRNGLHATFMPKPIYGINGSGMHTHMSLFSNNVNIFYDAKAQCEQ